MALWLVRAGKDGEHEQHFLDNGRIYLAWSGLHNRVFSDMIAHEAIHWT